MDWKGFSQRGRNYLTRFPSWAWLLAASIVLAIVLFIAFAASGPSYVPLFDGLSAKQGGQVINELQKLGIPYQLNSSGSIIRVPSDELARARLKLGDMNVPAAAGSQAWEQLTKGSLTVSQMAEDALSKRALEDNLERAISGIRGIQQARVTLALPKSTPFLKSQPHPKASVWLRTTATGISATQARAIAQMVANSVPGLDAERVVVTDQNGNTLAPSANHGVDQAQQQLDFEGLVEARAVRHIQALLDPLVGAKNLRISAASSIDFSQVSNQGVHYGPQFQVGHLQRETHREQGEGNTPQGTPGALSNQPPGNAAAPLQKTNGNPTTAATSHGNQTGNPPGSRNSGQSQQPQSRSSSNRMDVLYKVDQTTTVTHEAPWRLQALSVSVVLNQSAVGQQSHWTQNIKDIISHAIAAPHLNVNVATVPFGLPRVAATQGTWGTLFGNQALVQAVMELLAAVLILLGVARPLARWIKEALPVPALATGGAAVSIPESGESSESTPPGPGGVIEKRQPSHLERARSVAESHPAEAAEVIRRWIFHKESDDDSQARGAVSR